MNRYYVQRQSVAYDGAHVSFTVDAVDVEEAREAAELYIRDSMWHGQVVAVRPITAFILVVNGNVWARGVDEAEHVGTLT